MIVYERCEIFAPCNEVNDFLNDYASDMHKGIVNVTDLVKRSVDAASVKPCCSQQQTYRI